MNNRAKFDRAVMALTPELVARTIRPVPNDGPEPGWTPLPEAELDALVRRVEAESEERTAKSEEREREQRYA